MPRSVGLGLLRVEGRDARRFLAHRHERVSVVSEALRPRQRLVDSSVRGDCHARIRDCLRLRPLDGEEPIDVYEEFRQRYERGSTMLTPNRAIEEWYPLFLGELMA